MKSLKNSAIYVAGEIISKGIGFFLLPYVSHKMGPEAYGELSYYSTITALFGLVLAMGQGEAVSRHYYFYGKRSMNLIVRTGYAYTILLGILMLIFCGIFRSEVMAYLVISAVFGVLISTQLSIRQCQKQASSYIAIQIISAVVSSLATIITLEIYQTDLAIKRVIATLFSNILVFLIAYFLYTQKTETSRKFSWKTHKIAFLYILGLGLPLIFHGLSGFLKGHTDRILIYNKFTKYELGLYSMGVNLASIWSILIFAVNKAMVPYYFEGLKKGEISRKKVHHWAFLSLLFVPIPSLVMYMIPNDLLIWLFSEKFDGTKNYIILFLASFSLAIPYLFLVNYLFYHAKSKLIATCSIISTGIYLVSLWALSYTSVEYLPWASVLGAVGILPILYYMTLKVNVKK